MFVWVGKEAGYDIIVIGRHIGRVASVLAAMLCMAEFVTHMIRTAFAIYILYITNS